ncbi:MAG: chromosome partitioning protein [bacterium]|nr:MAG: chromosome partitioning protein [bacterium]
MQVISIANQKGGCAKTATSVCLATALAKHNKRVLLVDLDQQAHSTIWLLTQEVAEATGIYQVLIGKSPILSEVKKSSSLVDVLPANAELAGLELGGWTKIGARKLSRSLAEVKDLYDLVIIDCPPNLGLAVYNALVASDQVIAPIDCGPESYESISRLKMTLQHIASEYNCAPELIPLLTFVERTKIAQMITETTKSEFTRVLPSVRKNTAIPEAFAARMPIYQYDPNSGAAKDYTLVAENIIKWHEKN